MTEKYGFLFNRAKAIGFRIGDWIKVSSFRDLIDKRIASKSYISEYDILSDMNEVLKSIGTLTDKDAEVDGVKVGMLRRIRNDLQKFIEKRDYENHEFAKEFAQIYKEIMANRYNEDYVVNPKQMNKFLDLLSWFMHKAQEYGDRVSVPKLEPKDEHGSMTATFLMLDLRGKDEIFEFSSRIKECSILSFDLGTDGIIIRCTVPNVFVRNDC